ncbi:hypothetical protein EYR41_002945 [Orbilia oligospora]|uniref:Uncharacterized protein n=1 Tax=Orbilia oligospora TaxID=2813651 RepID=A0A8H2HR04_ORBOL|nr:hypothetical protein EYR41_002945 [Orbilia oligospora]
MGDGEDDIYSRMMETNIIHVLTSYYACTPEARQSCIRIAKQAPLFRNQIVPYRTLQDSTGHYITYTHLEEESYIDRGFHKRTLAPLPRPLSGLKT